MTSCGLRPWRTSGPSPRRSSVPGRKFSISACAPSTSSSSTARSSSTFRSRATNRLLRLANFHHRPRPSRGSRQAMLRRLSPSGRSTLMTSAPKSARYRATLGPAITVDRSRTRRSANGSSGTAPQPTGANERPAGSVARMRGGPARRVTSALLALAVVAGVAACAPSAPPPGGPSGCGRAAAPVLTQSRQLTSGGVVRQFLLTIPDRYDPNVPTPLILNFHGLGSDATQQAVYTQLDARAKARGFIVATPNGIGGTMDVTAPSVDHQYVIELVRYLNSILCVSPFERYSTGMSMGGFMSSALACVPELGLRAIAGVTGLFGACANGRSMPVMAFHGTADPIVAYSLVRDAVTSWAERDRCGRTPSITSIAADVQVRTFTGCRAGLDAAVYTVVGGGHTWPDGLVDLPAFGPTTRTIDATDLILDFFSAQ